MIRNHYGVTVNSEKPTTGVFQNNHVEYMWDAMNDAVSLQYEEALDEFIGEKIKELIEFLGEYLHSEDYEKLCDLVAELNEPDLDCVDSTDWLIGFMQVKSEDKSNAWYWFDNLGCGYIPDPDAECSAIVGEVYTQVVRSRWVLTGSLCSPCYPGQVDADSEGDFLAYSLPPDYFEDDNPLKKRIRSLTV